MKELTVGEAMECYEKTGKEFPCNDGNIVHSDKFMGIPVIVRYNCEKRIFENMKRIRRTVIQTVKIGDDESIDILYGKLSGLTAAIFDLDMIDNDDFMEVQNRLLKFRRKLKRLHR